MTIDQRLGGEKWKGVPDLLHAPQMRLSHEEIRDVASMVVPHAERPRFRDLLLIRTRCPDTYSKIVWMKAQHEGALTPPCIVWTQKFSS